MTQPYSNQGSQDGFHAREASAAPAASFKRALVYRRHVASDSPPHATYAVFVSDLVLTNPL